VKFYHGIRTDQGCIVSIEDNDESRLLPLRLDLEKHSPDGFEWGYGRFLTLQRTLPSVMRISKQQGRFGWTQSSARRNHRRRGRGNRGPAFATR